MKQTILHYLFAAGLASHLSLTAWAHEGVHPAKGSESAPAEPAATILGHGSDKYKVDLHWAKADPNIAPVINSHAMVEGRDGLIYLVTDHPQNAFLVFKKDGTFVRAFGKGLEGGHGVEIFEHNGEEFLIHVDCGWHFEAEGWKPSAGNGRVTLLKTDGTIVRHLPTPYELGIGEAGPKKFMPCDVAVTAQHTILIADGYASNYIYEMTMTGELVKRWGGRAEGKPEDLQNAHGISMDTSNPAKTLVWVPSRSTNQIKAFTLAGEYVETIELPGAYAGQLFFRGDRIYTAVCWSKENGTGPRLNQSGFLLVMDRASHKVISAPGGNEPVYVDGKIQPLYQT